MMYVKLLFFLLIVSTIYYIETKKLKRRDMKKEMKIYTIFLMFSSVVFIIELMEIEVPNPLEGVRVIFEPIGRTIEQLFTSGG
ncbi:hypothetical protein JOC85_000637 [Bacillus mesophilus]|uniref:Uncharacterized protein n=1 Tax=Bacillus mesophilus TaxID=1808955 RepID=A0A6M0Q4K9_9BACI|nr:hypothetical protein [Bacillus mesophilus]MBM7659870.1 hypothetical protein [Bacillus mesophilus]NEY70729.1 hypothetical protein [Bacillus mesophilus]